MATYLKLLMELLPSFEKFELVQIPHVENAHADALSKLTSRKDSELLIVVPIKHILKPSIATEDVIWVEGTPT